MTLLHTIPESSSHGNNQSEDDMDSSFSGLVLEGPVQILHARPNPVKVRKVKLGNPRRRPAGPSLAQTRQKTQAIIANPTITNKVSPVKVVNDEMLANVVVPWFNFILFIFLIPSCLFLSSRRSLGSVPTYLGNRP